MTIKMKPIVDYRDEMFADYTEMYEFSRLANYLIHGIANELKRQDYTDDEITKLLSHKWLRKSLDGHESLFRELGNTFGKTLVHLSWRDIPKNLDDEG